MDDGKGRVSRFLPYVFLGSKLVKLERSFLATDPYNFVDVPFVTKVKFVVVVVVLDSIH